MAEINNYFKERIKNIIAITGSQEKNYSQETFHKLRVEIKRLNAVIHFENYCSQRLLTDSSKKNLELVYKQAGKIRKTHIFQMILNKHFPHEMLPEYTNLLGKIESKHKERYFCLIDNNPLDTLKTICSKTKTILEECATNNIDSYLLEQKNNLRKLLNKEHQLNPENAHSFRQALKEFQYIQESITTEEKYTISLTNIFLAKTIGEWHDYETFIRHLKKIIKEKQVCLKELKLLVNIKEVFSARNKSLLFKINEVIKGIELD